MVPKWMMNKLVFEDMILCRLRKENRKKYYFTPIFHNLEDPKYKFGEKYLFDITDYDSNSNSVTIKDPETKSYI